MHNAFTHVNAPTAQCHSYTHSNRNLVIVAFQSFWPGVSPMDHSNCVRSEIWIKWRLF